MTPIHMWFTVWLLASSAAALAPSFTAKWSAKPFGTTLRYRSSNDEGNQEPPVDTSAPLAVEGSLFDTSKHQERIHKRLPNVHPSNVAFAPSQRYYEQQAADASVLASMHSDYPFAIMMQGSAPYIAAHAGQIAVFHLPGEILEHDKQADQLFSDMALAWLLGMKIVIVVGCRYDMDVCDLDFINHPHECHNSLTVTDRESLRRVEEEAGYLRTEVERKLNRYLRMHGGVTSSKDRPAPEGNVVSGNFYTAQRFGEIRGEDFEYTGFTSSVNTKRINQVVGNNDIVLLTTVGLSPMGELVNVNGYHLTATVASSLEAYKLIYFSNEGTVLQRKDSDDHIGEVPLSLAQSILDYHQVQVHNTGFATFEAARQALDPGAVELLLHLGWATWALENGVERAHIVNPGDGAILEELFTSKNGANTCLLQDPVDPQTDKALYKEDWDEFFASAANVSGSAQDAAFR